MSAPQCLVCDTDLATKFYVLRIDPEEKLKRLMYIALCDKCASERDRHLIDWYDSVSLEEYVDYVSVYYTMNS